ncbi:MAG: NAD(P)H-quinone oxidoreductase [Acidiferrobacterales bacterium]|nr:NAD(P)H-quinone oxidoreductase [Acidiferrobacterales bacterium]
MSDRTMKVVDLSEFGDADVLDITERPIPEPANGEVLIKVAAAGLNRADIMQRNGQYPPPPGASDILGLEVSGQVVSAAPDADGVAVGDEVCALLAGGGYAEYCTAPASSCLPVPKSLDIVEAGAVPETFFTVWTNVFMRGNLKDGERILVHGGTSGIGTTAIQLANAFGAQVCATAGSKEKCNAIIELGAEHAINYREADFVEEVKAWTNGQGVDVILDIVGGAYLSKNIKCLAPEGRLVIIATQGGLKSEINVLPIMLKRLTVTGSTLRARTVSQKSEIAEQLRKHAWPLLDNGDVRPIIDSIFPMTQVRDAHRRLDSGTHIGKVLLQIS